MSVTLFVLSLLSALPSFAKSNHTDIVVLTTEELQLITNAAKSTNMPIQTFQDSLILKLQKRGRVTTLDSLKSINCDGHACTLGANGREGIPDPYKTIGRDEGTPDGGFRTTLLRALEQQGRVTTHDSLKSLNCDGHACTVSTN